MSPTSYSPAISSSGFRKDSLVFLSVFYFLYLFYSFFPITPQDSQWHLVLADTDSYTRLSRVWAEMCEGWSWGSPFPYYNTPFGIELHWTKPLDVCLWISTYILSPFMEMKQALYYGSFFWNPFFLIASAVVVAWGVHPSIGRLGALFAGLMVLLFPFLIGNAQPNHIDHHIMEVFFQCSSIALMIRGVYPKTLGIIFALGLWVAIEFGLFVGVSLCILYFTHKEVRIPIFYMSLALSLFLFLERGPLFWSPTDVQRLSLVHVFMSWASYFSLKSAESRFPDDSLRRFLLGGFLLMSLMGLYWLIFQPTLQVIDPSIKNIWFDRVDEIRSVYQDGQFDWRFFPIIGTSALAIWYASQRDRVLLFPIIIFSVLTLWHIRHAYYLSPYVAVVLGLWGGRILHQVLKDKNYFPLIGVVLLFQMPSFLGSFPLLAGFAQPSQPSGQDIPKLVEAIKNKVPQGSRVFIHPDLEATALVWHLGVSTVTAPYHQNVAGILDAHFMMTSSDVKEVLRRLELRQIDYVLLPKRVSYNWIKHLQSVLVVGNYHLFRLKKDIRKDTQVESLT